MTVPTVVWWNHERMSFSCCHMLNQMFDSYNCRHLTRYDGPYNLDGGILVFHGGNAQLFGNGQENADMMNRLVVNWNWAMFISIGDEGAEFPLHRLYHPRAKLWVQAPSLTTVADRYLIQGYPDHCIRDTTVERDLDYFFSGQVTHPRRRDCHQALTRYWEQNPNGMILATQGFGQGLPYPDYLRFMSRAKIVPCPAGSSTVDTFRVYEALECGAVPLLDSRSPIAPHSDVRTFWSKLLNDYPLLTIDQWAHLEHSLPPILEQWDFLQRWTQAWWRAYKHDFNSWLARDMISLGAINERKEEEPSGIASAAAAGQVRNPSA